MLIIASSLSLRRHHCCASSVLLALLFLAVVAGVQITALPVPAPQEGSASDDSSALKVSTEMLRKLRANVNEATKTVPIVTVRIFLEVDSKIYGQPNAREVIARMKLFVRDVYFDKSLIDDYLILIVFAGETQGSYAQPRLTAEQYVKHMARSSGQRSKITASHSERTHDVRMRLIAGGSVADNAIGYAFINTMCNSTHNVAFVKYGNYAASNSVERTGEELGLVFSHELAHVLGVTHDLGDKILVYEKYVMCSNENFIMEPIKTFNIETRKKAFSTCSKFEATQLKREGALSCLKYDNLNIDKFLAKS